MIFFKNAVICFLFTTFVILKSAFLCQFSPLSMDFQPHECYNCFCSSKERKR